MTTPKIGCSGVKRVLQRQLVPRRCHGQTRRISEPGTFSLHQNYSNRPFSSSETIPSWTDEASSKVDSGEMSDGKITNVFSKYQKMHNRLLEVPLQHYDSSLWNEGVLTMHYWLAQLKQQQQQQDQLKQHQVHRMKKEAISFETCFELWGRWVRETNGPKLRSRGPQEMELIILFNNVLNEWRLAWMNNDTDMDPAKMLERIHTYTDNCPWMQVSTVTMNILLAGASHSPEGRTWDLQKAPSFAEKIMQGMTRYNLKPDVVTLSSVVHIWSQSELKEAPFRAEALLRQAQKTNHVEPNNSLYTTVIDTWVKSSHPKAMQRAQALIEEMERSPSQDIFPTTASLCCILRGLAMRSHEPGNSSRALGILKTMIHSYQVDENSHVKPNPRCFAATITALARNGEAMQAQNVLHEMQALYEQTLDPSFRPSSWCYNALVDAWSKRGNPEKVQAVINQMNYLAEKTGDTSLMPTRISMNSLLHALSRQHKYRKGSQRTEDKLIEKSTKVLQMMDNAYRVGKRIDMRPDKFTYGAVLDCMAMSSRPDAAECCEDLLRHMQQQVQRDHTAARPNDVMFNTVINAWSRSRHPQAALRAESLLEEMKDSFHRTGDSSLAPTEITYSSVMTAWARSKLPDAEKKLLFYSDQFTDQFPMNDTNWFISLSAWAKRGGVRHMEEIVHKIENMFFVNLDRKDEGEKSGGIIPTTRMYNLLLTAYSKAAEMPDAAERAEATFVRMKEWHDKYHTPTQPDTVSMGAVLHAWAKSKHPKAAERAEMILRQSIASGDERVKANVICFNTVLNAWKRSPDPKKAHRAEALLNEMWHRYDTNLDRSVRPDKISYASCIGAWRQSGHPKSGEKAQVLFDSMLERASIFFEAAGRQSGDFLNLKPDVVIYNALIAAWIQQQRHCSSEEEAREIEVRMERLRQESMRL